MRPEGTYSKNNSLADKINVFHYFTTYIKFDVGRMVYDASQEIRNNYLTREEGMALVRRFDSEFPHLYFQEIMGYIGSVRLDFISCAKSSGLRIFGSATTGHGNYATRSPEGMMTVQTERAS